MKNTLGKVLGYVVAGLTVTFIVAIVFGGLAWLAVSIWTAVLS